jgi:hypothetical protein
MAFTAVGAVKTVHGNQNVWQGTVTADAVSGSVSFGFGILEHVIVSAKSATTGNLIVRLNQLAGGTAAAGSIGISQVASGDEWFVTVYGR